MEYKTLRSGNLKSIEKANDGEVRLINNNLYFCYKVHIGGYGYRESYWKLLNFKKIENYKI